MKKDRSRFPLWALFAFGATAVAAGVTAAAVVRGGKSRPGRDASTDEPEVERSITIGKTAAELSERWREPTTLSRIMDGFATARPSADGRTHWKVEGPLGLAYEWESEAVDERHDEGIGWRSVPGASIPNEGSVRFRAGPADHGTVATLCFRFDPPGGALGEAAVKHLGRKPLNLAADGVLRRFKSLVETGEIPTTERQPAARADTR